MLNKPSTLAHTVTKIIQQFVTLDHSNRKLLSLWLMRGSQHVTPSTAQELLIATETPKGKCTDKYYFNKPKLYHLSITYERKALVNSTVH